MIVVADTSVLLNLCRIQHEDLLFQLFHEVIIPLEVAAEFDRLGKKSPFQGLLLPIWVQQKEPSAIPASIRATTGLDPGETAAIALALEIRADALLIDERHGHQVAVQLGIRTIGVLGILLQAKASRLLTVVRPCLDRLEKDARFWIAPGLRARVLKLAGEE